MALIKCTECGGKVSNKAIFCPHCGYPLTRENRGVNIKQLYNNEYLIPHGGGDIADNSVQDDKKNSSFCNFEIKEEKLIKYTGKDSIVQIPEGIVRICKNAFYGSKELRQVIFPKSLRYIEEYAFMDCALHAIVLNDGILEIGNESFEQRWTKKSVFVYLPDSIKKIGENAFGRQIISEICYDGDIVDWSKLKYSFRGVLACEGTRRAWINTDAYTLKSEDMQQIEYCDNYPEYRHFDVDANVEYEVTSISLDANYEEINLPAIDEYGDFLFYFNPIFEVHCERIKEVTLSYGLNSSQVASDYACAGEFDGHILDQLPSIKRVRIPVGMLYTFGDKRIEVIYY